MATAISYEQLFAFHRAAHVDDRRLPMKNWSVPLTFSVSVLPRNLLAISVIRRDIWFCGYMLMNGPWARTALGPDLF